MELSVDVERVVVELTQVCNNACLHCYNFWRTEGRDPASPRELTRADCRSLIGNVRRDAPLTQVTLSGGEPTLRRDLPDIVCDLTVDGLDSVVITNGTRLTDAYLQRFPEGSTFEVTLFGADRRLHDRIAGRRVFEDVLEGLVRLSRFKVGFVLACVITRRNAHDVLRTIELGVALGAEAVLLNRVNLSRGALEIADELVPSTSMLRDSFAAAEEAAIRYGISVAVSVPVPPCVLEPTDYPHLHFGWCPRGGKDAYYTIGSRGQLRPCNHSSVVLGNLFRQGFAEILDQQGTRDFWAPVPDECRECQHPLRDRCRGGCPAAADECYGSRSRIDPFVGFARA